MSLEDIEKNIYKPGWKKEEKPKPEPKKSPTWVEFESKETPAQKPQIIDIPFNKEDLSQFSQQTLQSKAAFFKKYRWIWIGALGLIVIGAGLYLWFISSSGGLLLDIKGPQEIHSGDIVDYEFQYANQTNHDLTDAMLEIDVPQNTVVVNSDAWGQPPILRRSLGIISKNKTASEKISLIMIAPPQTPIAIKTKLTYKVYGIQSSSEVDKDMTIAVVGSAIVANFNTPTNILANQPFDATVELKNFSDHDFQKARVILEYPDGFTASAFTIKPSIGNTIWDFDALPANSTITFTVRGMMGGLFKSQADFKSHVGLIMKNQYIELGSGSSQVTIKPFPVSVNILADDARDTVAQPGKRITYTINYVNDSDNSFRNIVVDAKLDGNMFDLSSIIGDGKYSSLTKTITWNAATNPELSVLSPNEKGLITFNIDVDNVYPAHAYNPLLNVNVSLSSPDFPSFTGLATDLLKATDALSTKVVGQLSFNQKAFYRDAPSLILNQGPWPPRANQATQYTIHWQVQAIGNDMNNIEIHSALPPNVQWTNTIKVPDGFSAPTIDNRSGQISWKIDALKVSNGLVDLIFQISATPSANDVNRVILLVQGASASAEDAFTNVKLNSTDHELTTALTDDPTVKTNEGGVQL